MGQNTNAIKIISLLFTLCAIMAWIFHSYQQLKSIHNQNLQEYNDQSTSTNFTQPLEKSLKIVIICSRADKISEKFNLLLGSEWQHQDIVFDVWIIGKNRQQIKKQQQIFVQNLSNWHKISSQIHFISQQFPFESTNNAQFWQKLSSAELQLLDASYVFIGLDKQQFQYADFVGPAVQRLIEQNWLYDRKQLADETLILIKTSSKAQKNRPCRQQLSNMLSISGKITKYGKLEPNRELLFSQDTKQLARMPSNRQMFYLMRLILQRQNIYQLYLLSFQGKKQEQEMLHVIVQVFNVCRNRHTDTGKDGDGGLSMHLPANIASNFYTNLKRNLIINDLVMNLSTYQTLPLNKQGSIIVTTVQIFDKNVDNLRPNILTHGQKVIAYASYLSQSVDLIDKISKQFSVREISKQVFGQLLDQQHINALDKLGSSKKGGSLYLIQKPIRLAKKVKQKPQLKIQESQLNFNFSKMDGRSEYSPLWTKTYHDQLNKNKVQFGSNCQIYKPFYEYHVFNRQNQSVYENLFKFLQAPLNSKQIQSINRPLTIVWCLDFSHRQLFFHITNHKLVQSVYICQDPLINKEDSKKLNKIAILNDFGSKIKKQINKQSNSLIIITSQIMKQSVKQGFQLDNSKIIKVDYQKCQQKNKINSKFCWQ